MEFAEAAGDLIDERLRQGDAIRFTVPSWSMAPFLKPGDQLVVRRASEGELRPGDIVIRKIPDDVKSTGQVWLAHRLIEQHREDGKLLLVTKGDSSTSADTPAPSSQIPGVVIAIQRQESGELVKLTSRRARLANALLGFLSQSEWRVQRASGPAEWLVRKATRLSLRTLAFAARVVVK